MNMKVYKSWNQNSWQTPQTTPKSDIFQVSSKQSNPFENPFKDSFIVYSRKSSAWRLEFKTSNEFTCLLLAQENFPIVDCVCKEDFRLKLKSVFDWFLFSSYLLRDVKFIVHRSSSKFVEKTFVLLRFNATALWRCFFKWF